MNRYFWVVVVGSFLLHLMPLHAGAQRIYFSDTTNAWKTYKNEPPEHHSPHSYYEYYISDTLVESNGYYYAEMKWSLGFDFEQFLVREDTLAGLVFVKARSRMGGLYTVKDTNEFVYMNYNLHVGDTLIMPLVYTLNAEDSISLHVVNKIDSFFVNGLKYRRFEMDAYRGMGIGPNGNIQTRYAIYEGIGPDSGPFIESGPFYEWGPPTLYCFRNHGIIPPNFNQYCFDPVGIKEPAEERKHILFYPNPVLNLLQVKDQERSGNPYFFKIVDLSGKVLRQMTFRNEATLDLHELPPGLYFLHFLKGPAIVQYEKLIISH